MRIAEIFRSRQGEGFLTGTDSLFVRTSGCNLRCTFCDTPYTSWEPEGDDLSVDEILAEVDRHPVDHAVLTGGEPMLFAELIPLCDALRERQLHITVETAGTLYLPLACDLISISPKMSNSTPLLKTEPKWHERHELTRENINVLKQLVSEHAYQLKFVVESPDDFAEIDRLLDRLPDIQQNRVMLMPQGKDVATLAAKHSWLESYCRQRGFTFCPRRHIEWYGLVRGK